MYFIFPFKIQGAAEKVIDGMVNVEIPQEQPQGQPPLEDKTEGIIFSLLTNRSIKLLS